MSATDEARGTAVVRRLDDPDRVSVALAGGKGAGLAAMTRAGLPVPPGFVVATAAYRQAVEDNGLAPVIRAAVEGLDPADPDALQAASARLRPAFENAVVPGAVVDAITAAYARLGGGPVAVRSSATAEDLPEASFAGQQETFLGVEGAAETVEAVRRCWSSLWTARAIAYRAEQGVPHDRVAIAVVVQRMVAAAAAGVLFTADPVSGRRDRMVLEAGAQPGEVVGGRVTPDRWVLDAGSGTVVGLPTVAQPAAEAPTRTAARPAPAGVRGLGPALDQQRIRALAELGARTAELFGGPQDVEWAVATDGRCWLLQSRPITSLFPLPQPPPPAGSGLRVYLSVNLAAQGFAEPFTPMGVAFFRALVAGGSLVWPWTGRRRLGRRRQAPSWLTETLGRLYSDITPILLRPRTRERVVERLSWKDPVASAALRGWLARNADRLPTRPRAGFQPTMTGWLLRLLPGYVRAAVAPDRTRRRVVAMADAAVERWQRGLAPRGPAERMDFVENVVAPEAMGLIGAQLGPLMVGLSAGMAADRAVRGWLGEGYSVEPVRRWLPHDPTTQMSLDLWRLAQRLDERGEEPTPANEGVREFLARYGHRAADREVDVGVPRFADDPAYVLQLLGAYRRHGGRVDAERRRAEDTAAAERAAAELVAATRRAKGPVRASLLRLLLDRARALAGLRERPKFDLVRAIGISRRMLQQAGAELVRQGRLDAPDDVFFLDPGDIRRPGPDLRSLVAAHRRVHERELSRRTIPRVIISDGEQLYGGPPGEDAGRRGDAVRVSRLEAEGGDGRARTLAGTPVSPGVHQGTVRVVDTPLGARLEPGDVLVASTTDPGWTPLFLTAGALVMEVGGTISHGAIVAREYGVPAVAGIQGATVRLHTGQHVRVDGEAGTVTVLDDPALVATSG